ncbi:hypothetical protein EIN_520790 [Entamoeba invadens IP1]|uniref:EGF-like domain-containing protein n=1 Tax=Entamoeba invadens IP1 TaxID=370355 RepID=A0A0A1U9L6_ENTIV|nr:hypothetical protein EIN_520790 [Entamoeba invadens IP1]ELP91722.1 hypothetical protein EIN_520790 [Entamoeba invadens IP1]|eukprot:XP_004258493.1 hypothetical protein EIN_520790 [Entamoeba invadens IP1]
MFPLILLVAVNAQNSSTILCPEGCATGCLTDNTCRRCSVGYDNDNSCMNCEWYNRNLNMKTIYLKNDSKCVKFDSLILKDSWLPPEEFITEIQIDEPIVFDLDESSDIDTGFCFYKNKYRFGKWFKLLYNVKNSSHVRFDISQIGSENTVVTIDVTNSAREQNSDCYAHTVSNVNTNSKRLHVPVVSPYKDDPQRNMDDFYFYIFVHLGQFSKVTIELNAKVQNGRSVSSRFNLTLNNTKYLTEHPGEFITWDVPLEEYGTLTQPICYSTYRMKYIAFNVEFNGTGKLLIDATVDGKMNYLQEYDMIFEQQSDLKCVQGWSGRRHGVLSEDAKAGAFVTIDANENVERHFAFISEDQRSNFVVKFSVICPENCNYENGLGTCSPSEGKCRCKKGYGGSNCHKLCYYDNNWQISPNDNLCYFGSEKCDEYCNCEEGTVFVDHRCLSEECASGSIGINDECSAKSEGCTPTCKCDSSRGFHMSSSGICLSNLCGFVTDPESKNSCIPKGISAEIIAVIVVLSSVFGLAFLITLTILLFFVIQYKKTDIELFKQQQPTYHFYITGSLNKTPSVENRYLIDPITLDFGKGTEATAIMDTRFQRIDLRNMSKNKYMMIIFHTPNSPKYNFHFDPQVVIIRPRSGTRTITCYMTIYCTTKLRGMKIPYTVWFSQSRRTLNELSMLLKDKNFDEWTNEQQKHFEKLSKTVLKRFHHYFTISTDAASSTHIDMDELNMSDKPIAEGAMGRVYMGSY